MQPSPSLLPWPNPPHPLAPEPGELHVFRLSLKASDELSEAWRCLSPEEQERAGRLRTDRLRRRYWNAHVQLRYILASCLGCSPADIQYEIGAHGKPYLAPGTGLQFNLSHSADVGLVAVCHGQEVGVDIEAWREDVDRGMLARRFFAAQEAATIAALPPEDQLRAFFSVWTRKEAYIKCRGGGLSIPLDSFEVSVDPPEPVMLFDLAPERALNRRWSLYEISPGEGFSAAVALEGAARRILCWDWMFDR